MGSKQSIYKNITRRWQSEAAGNLDSVVILSPYITGPTSETVTQDVNPAECNIYMLFDAEVFAIGSSSLQAVKKLSQRGFTLYHLPGLHAKVLLTSEGFASVGSQNLTGRGTRNLEASSVINEEKQIAELRKLVENWIEARELITLEMILDMEDLLKPVIKSFKVAQRAAAEVDLLIVEKENVRQEERQRLAEERRIKAEEFRRREAEETAKRKAEESARREATLRLSKLQEIISKSAQARYPIYCRLRTVDTGSWETPSSTSSLMVSSSGDDFRNWIIDGEAYHLGKGNRYVCLIEESGKFGWARVMKTRLTFFHRSVSKSTVLLLGKTRCYLQFHAMWLEAKENSSGNLVIEACPLGTRSCVQVRVWLSLNSVEVLDIRSKASTGANSRLENWIKSNIEEFKRTMLGHFLSPFTYEKKLAGVEAGTFLRGHSRIYYYKVKLHLIGNGKLLAIHR